MCLQRQYYSDTSPDFDPHHAPLIASSITGRPTAQVERKFQEYTRLWNPSNQTMPLGIYGMPPPSSQPAADFSKELKDVQRSVSTSLVDAIAEMRSLLEAKSASTKSPGNDVAGDDTALISVLKTLPQVPLMTIIWVMYPRLPTLVMTHAAFQFHGVVTRYMWRWLVQTQTL